MANHMQVVFERIEHFCRTHERVSRSIILTAVGRLDGSRGERFVFSAPSLDLRISRAFFEHFYEEVCQKCDKN